MGGQVVRKTIIRIHFQYRFIHAVNKEESITKYQLGFLDQNISSSSQQLRKQSFLKKALEKTNHDCSSLIDGCRWFMKEMLLSDERIGSTKVLLFNKDTGVGDTPSTKSHVRSSSFRPSKDDE